MWDELFPNCAWRGPGGPIPLSAVPLARPPGQLGGLRGIDLGAARCSPSPRDVREGGQKPGQVVATKDNGCQVGKGTEEKDGENEAGHGLGSYRGKGDVVEGWASPKTVEFLDLLR
jgi:hypothetical protein